MNDNKYYLFPTEYKLRIIYFYALDAFSQYLYFFSVCILDTPVGYTFARTSGVLNGGWENPITNLKKQT